MYLAAPPPVLRNVADTFRRASLAAAGKPTKDSGTTQEQYYVKTVIELHDKYLQVVLIFLLFLLLLSVRSGLSSLKHNIQ